MKRTAQTVEESKAKGSAPEVKPEEKKDKRGKHPNSLKNLRPWKPGDCPNPEGKNGNDVAKEIAQAIFSNNQEEIYKAFANALFKGNAYAFDVIANRAFGKLKETQELGDKTLSVLQRLSAGRKRAHERNSGA